MGGAKRPSSPEDETGGHNRHGGTRRRNDAVICGKSGRGQNNVSLRSVRKSVICRPMTRAGSVLPLNAFLAAADGASTRQPPSPSPAHAASRPIPTVMHFPSPPGQPTAAAAEWPRCQNGGWQRTGHAASARRGLAQRPSCDLPGPRHRHHPSAALAVAPPPACRESPCSSRPPAGLQQTACLPLGGGARA